MPYTGRVSSTLWWLVLLLSLGGCQRSAPARPEPDAVSSTTPGRVQAWGAALTLPEAFEGGRTDYGGYELTDGELAVLIGKHPRQPSESLRDAARRHANKLDSRVTSEREHAVARTRVLVLEARSTEDGGSVQLWLLVAPLGPELLTVLLVGSADSAARGAKVWADIVASLELP